MAAPPAEQKKQYHVCRAFKALNTKAHRTAIDADEFSWLQNAQPIGPGNIKLVPGQLASQTNASANVLFLSNVTSMSGQELKGNTYVAAYTDNGAGQIYDVNNGNLITFAANATFSTANVNATQFNKSYIISGDSSKGLFVYDGNVNVHLGSGGAIGMLNVGAGYANVPAVVVSPPNEAGGIQAAAQAVLTGNTVSEVFWTQPGTGYTAPPTITISGGGGNNAQAITSLTNFRIGQVYYQLLNGGQNWTHGNVAVTGGGGDGTALGTFIISNGSVVNIIATSLGNNYSNQANLVVAINGDGSNAQVSAFVESNLVTDVATYAGRLWVSQGRQLLFSGATNFNDFTGISAGNFFTQDATLHGNILGMVVANNFLYFFGDDSVNVISDVLVNSNGTTNVTNTNLSASIGTNFPYSIFPYYRYIMLMNAYGVYGLIGSTMVKLSDALDGIYPFIDFTKTVTAGQVIINNILCACFNFYLSGYKAVPQNSLTIADGYYQAVFFDKKWFITSQSAMDFVTYTPVGNTIGLFGVSGKQLFRMYADNSSNAVSSVVQTALWPLNDPIRDKQVSKFGIEAEVPVGGGTITLTVDNPVNSSPANVITNFISWANISGTIIPWSNGGGNVIGWSGGLSGYQLYRGDAQNPPAIGGGPGDQKYLGFTVTSNTANLVYNTFELEYEERARF
jgi:hypothetical protein